MRSQYVARSLPSLFLTNRTVGGGGGGRSRAVSWWQEQGEEGRRERTIGVLGRAHVRDTVAAEEEQGPVGERLERQDSLRLVVPEARLGVAVRDGPVVLALSERAGETAAAGEGQRRRRAGSNEGGGEGRTRELRRSRQCRCRPLRHWVVEGGSRPANAASALPSRVCAQPHRRRRAPVNLRQRRHAELWTVAGKSKAEAGLTRRGARPGCPG